MNYIDADHSYDFKNDLDETFELDYRECEDSEESEDDRASEDRISADIDFDNAIINQGNTAVHQSITGSISTASISIDRHSSLSHAPDTIQSWPSRDLKRFRDDVILMTSFLLQSLCHLR